MGEFRNIQGRECIWGSNLLPVKENSEIYKAHNILLIWEMELLYPNPNKNTRKEPVRRCFD